MMNMMMFALDILMMKRMNGIDNTLMYLPIKYTPYTNDKRHKFKQQH